MMSSENNSTEDVEDVDDDALQELIFEAENLMHDLEDTNDNGDDDNNDEASSQPIGFEGFCIDSDDEEEPTLNGNDYNKYNTNTKAVDDHPLSEAFLSAPAAATDPLSGSGNSMPSLFTNGAPAPAAQGAVSMDVFKQQTTRFASNLASMAQRAASHVSAATAPVQVTGGPPMNMNMNMNPAPGAHPSFVPRQSYSQPTPATTAPPLSQSQLQSQSQSQPTPVTGGELDKEQKSQLIRDHVGELLPGERVIMFLTNLLHVSDTSGVSYVASQSSNSYKWCCVMSYYRLILFSTLPQEQLQVPVPSEWDATCWPKTASASTKVLEIPLASMDRVEKTVYQAAGSSYMGLVIYGKDCGRIMRFTTPSYVDTGRAYDSLNTYAFPGRRNLGYLFAFESKRQAVMASVQVDEKTGQQNITISPTPKRFDAMMEFPRLLSRTGITQSPWILWGSINSTYQLSPTYPSVLVGPATLDETKPESQHVIRQCAAFRSEQRFPSLTWCGVGGASIWRSSQPKVGLQGNRSPADELYLRHVAESARGANAMAEPGPIYPRSVLQQLTGDYSKDWVPEPGCGVKILDLRPRSAAMANRTGGTYHYLLYYEGRKECDTRTDRQNVSILYSILTDSTFLLFIIVIIFFIIIIIVFKGYGYENTSNYSGTTLQFCNIGNIHAVRDSYQKVCTLCNSDSTTDVSWNSLAEDTKWLSHIRLILAASWETAYWVHVWRLPVLVHCSHGWDRTSQVVALAQLLLDPFYRTRHGFSVLVEKDFMSFGHPFHTRCAHGEGRSDNKSGSAQTSSTDEGQISPIFLQFIDCVYQIVQLYPECFEFNTKYLLELSFQVYSCRFGSMLCDTERERELLAGIRQRTYAVWDYLDAIPELKTEHFVESQGVLLMPLPTLLRNVRLWTERHSVFGPKATLRQPASTTTTTTTTTPMANKDENASGLAINGDETAN
jgi:hypothetical protein